MAKQKETPKTKSLMAIKNTSTHCKGVFYDIEENKIAELVEKGLFQAPPIEEIQPA